MALSEHPNPAAAWGAAAKWLLALEDPLRASMVELAHEVYRSLSAVGSVPALLDVYRHRGPDPALFERARQLVPRLEPARACRVARDAAYFRRYRELLDGGPGRSTPPPPPRGAA